MKIVEREEIEKTAAGRFFLEHAGSGEAAVVATARGALAGGRPGMPLQDVLEAALYTLRRYQRIEKDAFREMPFPQPLREVFVRAARGYHPAPIDTSHVTETPEMERAAALAARSIHEGWRAARAAEGLTVADNPLLRPWKELSAEEKAPTMKTAMETVKAIAAMGGVEAAELDFDDVRVELCASLDQHVHEVWAKEKAAAGVRYGVERTKDEEGRDVTHPDMVPFDDLSEASKAYDHAIDNNVITVLRDNGISIAPQVSEAVQKTETRLEAMKDELSMEREVEDVVAKLDGDTDVYEPIRVSDLSVAAAVEGVVEERAARAFEASLLRSLMDPKTILPGEKGFVEGLRKMTPFPRDVAAVGCIIPAGAVPHVDADGKPSVKVLTYDGETKTRWDDTIEQAVRREMTRQGIRPLPYRTLRPGQPFVFNNLAPESRAPWLNAAKKEMQDFLDEGFSVSNGYQLVDAEPAVTLSQSRDSHVEAVLKERHPDLLPVLKGRSLCVGYHGDDPEVKRAVFDDRLEALNRTGTNPVRRAGNLFLEAVDWKTNDPDKRRISINAAVEGYKAQLGDPFSEASLLVAAARRNGTEMGITAELRRAFVMASTGRSYAGSSPDAVLAKAEERVDTLVGRSLAAYVEAMEEYHSKPAMVRLFSKEPFLPPQIQKDMVRAGDEVCLAFDTIYNTEKALCSVVDNGSSIITLGEGQPFVERQRAECLSMLRRLDAMLAKLPKTSVNVQLHNVVMKAVQHVDRLSSHDVVHDIRWKYGSTVSRDEVARRYNRGESLQDIIKATNPRRHAQEKASGAKRQVNDIRELAEMSQAGGIRPR